MGPTINVPKEGRGEAGLNVRRDFRAEEAIYVLAKAGEQLEIGPGVGEGAALPVHLELELSGFRDDSHAARVIQLARHRLNIVVDPLAVVFVLANRGAAMSDDAPIVGKKYQILPGRDDRAAFILIDEFEAGRQNRIALAIALHVGVELAGSEGLQGIVVVDRIVGQRAIQRGLGGGELVLRRYLVWRRHAAARQDTNQGNG